MSAPALSRPLPVPPPIEMWAAMVCADRTARLTGTDPVRDMAEAWLVIRGSEGTVADANEHSEAVAIRARQMRAAQGRTFA